MVKAIMGIKKGMTQLFLEDGTVVPVTVVEAGPCTVMQKKAAATDGYDAIQIGFGDIRERLVTKPLLGHFKKAGTAAKRHLREFHVDDLASYELGQQIKADIFEKGDVVDVSGTSKGKGFQGKIKRHGGSRGPMTHGSKSKRRVGSGGASSFPSRVIKGKAMPGHMGAETVTVQNLEVVEVDADKNVLIIKGAVPGPKGSLLSITKAVKSR